MAPTSVADIACEVFQAADLYECAEAAAIATSGKLEQLSQAVREFCDQPPHSDPDPDLYYPGGWTASFWQLSDSGPQRRLDPLIYYPRIAFHDPLAEYFYDRHYKFKEFSPVRFDLTTTNRGGSISELLPITEASTLAPTCYAAQRADLATCRREITYRLRALAPLEALLRDGTIYLIPELQLIEKRQEQIFTSVRHELRDERLVAILNREYTNPQDAPTVRNNLRGMKATIPHQTPTSPSAPYANQPFLYYLEKVLHLAALTGSTYAPDSSADRDLYVSRVGRDLDTLHVDARFLSAVTSLPLPGLPLDAPTVARIREDYQEFEDWRSALRKLRRKVPRDASEAAIREQILDSLMPEAHKIQRAHKNPLQRALQAENSVPIICELGALVTTHGSIPPGLISAGLLALKSLLPGGQEGQVGVLATLATRKSQGIRQS